MPYEREFLSAYDDSGLPNSFLPVAYGMFGQESSGGRASPNILQVTPSTAANPGYGIAPLAAQDIGNPYKSTKFAFDVLKAKAAHSGLSFDNPDDFPSILRLHNGGGDPNYEAHVASRIPNMAGPTGSAPEGPPVSGSLGNSPIVQSPPQVNYQPAPAPPALLEASDPRSRRAQAELFLRLGAGLAGKRALGEALEGGAAGAADALSNTDNVAAKLYEQQQLASLYGLKADTTNAGNEVRVGVANARNQTSVTNNQNTTDERRDAAEMQHSDRQVANENRATFQKVGLNLRAAITNQTGMRAAALNGLPYTAVQAPFPGAPAQAPSQAPSGPPTPAPALSPPLPQPASVQGPSAAPTGAPATPPQAPAVPFQMPPAPAMDPLALPRIVGPAAKIMADRDAYAKQHAADLSTDQSLLGNLDQYRGAYDRLQATPMSQPGAGAGWRIPIAAALHGNFTGNNDSAEITKQHNTLTAELAAQHGRTLVAGLRTAAASLPDQSVPYDAGARVLATAKANALLQQQADKARQSLMAANPYATPAQIEGAVSSYIDAVGAPYSIGPKGDITPRTLPSFTDWKSGKAPASPSQSPAAAVSPELRKRILADPEGARASPQLKKLGIDVQSILNQR